MREGGPTAKRFRLFVLQAVMIPIFTVLEASAVVYSLLSPERRFHVVHKPTIHVKKVGVGATLGNSGPRI